jgi:hypothetical protein
MICIVVSTVVLLTAASAGPVQFNRDVRPILSDNCFACHGFDAKKRKANLRLDEPEGLFTPNAEGVVMIQAGDPDRSQIWRRIVATETEEIMPPPETHKTVTPEQRAVLRRWIEQGAPYQKHWAFSAAMAPPVPAISGSSPLDAFIRERLAAEGLSPSPEAEKETLIRRVTFDLTGLPPTIAEVDAFLADTAPGAYERLVDRLFASPHHGEHMARYWLDLARYADTHGLHLDNERSMWPYRDWVVQAFNQNLPFDEFTRWQLAGDLIPGANREQRIASGFNRCNVTTSEGGSINEEFIFRYAVDRTASAVEVWMAMTAGCAVCHDHKFDPLSQKEFYSLYAFFNSAADPAMDGNKMDTPPILKLSTPEQESKLADLDRRIAEINGKIKASITTLAYTDPAQATPAPAIQTVENLWFEDGFPTGAKPLSSGAPLCLVTRDEGEVLSGQVALKRSAKGLEQDYFSGGAEFVVPSGSKLFAHCYLDPENPPEAIMVQFHTSSWLHRAVWGEEGKIPFGKPGTTEKVSMGALPKTAEWVRLELDPARLGLKPGTKVTGYAFTQAGGTVFWDKLGAVRTVDPAKDSAWSLKTWIQQNQGKRVEGLPQHLQTLVRSKKPEQWTEAEATQFRDYWLEHLYEGSRDVLASFKAERAPLETEKQRIDASIPLTFVMQDLDKPRDSFLMLRGAYDKPGEPVTRATPAFLPPLQTRSDAMPNRLDLANWLLRRDHPLTARVAVNRYWQQFFGTGLVKTSSDFGSQGEPPSHPELLDWLASHFIESGWDTRALVKMIVTSATYRQSARVTPELLARDPENRLLARGPRFRFDAEVLRDNALALSGLLDRTLGGKGVKPYQPPNIWEPVGFGGSNTREYKQDTGSALYRRSLYTFLKRTAPPPFMATFDAPNREQTCSRRERSNTPLQALQLMNDVQHFEAARSFAQRMLLEGGSTPEDRIVWGWRSVTSRKPSGAELGVALEAFRSHHARYSDDPDAARQAISYGESKANPKLDPAELAAYTLTANLLFNLDETLTKN